MHLHSLLVGLIFVVYFLFSGFEASIPTCACFYNFKHTCTHSLCILSAVFSPMSTVPNCAIMELKYPF